MNAADIATWTPMFRKISFFEDFNDDEIGLFLRHGELRKYGFHEFIVREADTDTTFFVIVRGRVKVVKRVVFNQRKQLGELESGDCFGEMAFLLQEPRQADIMATEQTYMYQIDATTIMQMSVESREKFYKRLCIMFAHKLKNSNLRTEDFHEAHNNR